VFIQNPENLIQELQDYLSLKDEKDTSTSASNVGWHLDHSLKVFNTVSENFLKSNPKMYAYEFNKWRTLCFILGYFPRGKAKAPRQVSSPKIITTKELELQFKLALSHTRMIKKAHHNAYFRHLIFGNLNKKRTIRFLQIHTAHHLKIIKDILK
jgi:hypothetical protein